jgi:hypothetical protein
VPGPLPLLTPWSNFYAMIGSAAAALTGLVFVVITLVTRTQRPGPQEGVATFTTPTVVHFCAAFLIAATLVAPWHAFVYPCWIIGLAGIYGVYYIIRLIARAGRMSGSYVPDLEDWVWYWLLPLLAYGATFVGAIALLIAPVRGLFVLAACTVLLIFIGIRNAWDLVTYLAIVVRNEPPQ